MEERTWLVAVVDREIMAVGYMHQGSLSWLGLDHMEDEA